MSGPPSLDDLRKAAERIAPYAHRTPVHTCSTIDEMAGASVFFKCENFQKAGAFKFRGACNAVFALTDTEAQRGVIAHSSGNHAQALALAATLRGVPARIVMPRTAPAVKQAAVASYGASITLCEPTLAARESMTQAIIKQTGAVLIHPYNDYRIVAGQGTAALELLEDCPGLDVLMTPVGGGGLVSGSALAAHYTAPDVRVIAGEPQGADDAYQSFKTGHIIPAKDPKTIADGLLTSLGDKTFPIIREYVEDIITVPDHAIVNAMRLVWERTKLVIEPSAAVPVAALLANASTFSGKRVGIILSGGNVDLTNLPWHT